MHGFADFIGTNWHCPKPVFTLTRLASDRPATVKSDCRTIALAGCPTRPNNSPLTRLIAASISGMEISDFAEISSTV